MLSVIRKLLDAKVATTRSVSAGGLASGGGDLSADRTITVTAATQAEAEAGSNSTTAMTPQRTRQAIDNRVPQALVAKAWVKFAGSNGDIAASQGVASVSRTGVGAYTITLSTAMASVNYVPIACVNSATGPEISISISSTTVFTVTVTSRVAGGSQDTTDTYVVVFGT
jgi:hypothetical protein